jgi:hypothetical protein
VSSHLDADDWKTALEEGPGRLPSRAADLEESVAWRESCQFDEVVEQLSRI